MILKKIIYYFYMSFNKGQEKNIMSFRLRKMMNKAKINRMIINIKIKKNRLMIKINQNFKKLVLNEIYLIIKIINK